MQPPFELIERVRQIAGRRPYGRCVRRQWSGVDQRLADRAQRLAEAFDIQSNAVPGEQRLETVALREQALPSLVIRGLAHASAVRVAEDVGKEHLGIFAIGLEKENI